MLIFFIYILTSCSSKLRENLDGRRREGGGKESGLKRLLKVTSDTKKLLEVTSDNINSLLLRKSSKFVALMSEQPVRLLFTFMLIDYLLFLYTLCKCFERQGWNSRPNADKLISCFRGKFLFN